MVWVNPLDDGRDRSRLDPMLRDVARAGVWVSAHPDVILKMGTKEVLFRTRDLSWDADTYLYETFETFQERFPSQKYAALVATPPPGGPCRHTTYVYRVVPRPGVPSSARVPRIVGCR
jgi:hypothetical protein